MLIVHSEAHRQHAPRHFLVRGALVPNAEIPERADRLLAAVRGAGHDIVAPDPIRNDVLAAVHTNDYLNFLRDGPAQWAALPGAAAETVAEKVTACPNTEGFVAETREVVVPAWLTTWLKAAEALVVKLASPL